MKNRENDKVYKLVLTALMAALCYVAFTFLKIPIPTPGGDTTALHIGNAFCVLAALLLGGGYGGVAGSLGMTIADLLDPVYITSAPKTFILKLCIGLIAGFVAHKIAHITEDHDSRYIMKWSLIASVAGLGFNVVGSDRRIFLQELYSWCRILRSKDHGNLGSRSNPGQCDCRNHCSCSGVYGSATGIEKSRTIHENQIKILRRNH